MLSEAACETPPDRWVGLNEVVLFFHALADGGGVTGEFGIAASG